jgi:ABC-type multidrug transport system fused ATPase/permease subunit
MLNAETSFINELKDKVQDYNQSSYDRNMTRSKYSLLASVMNELFYSGFVFLCIYLIISNKLTVAFAIAANTYIGRTANLSRIIEQLINYIKEFNISSKRVFDVINGTEFTKETFGTKHLDKARGDFEFKNVYLSYDDKQEVLKDLSFKINANTTVAFVGRSGTGKTTIFNLLCKMYDVDAGSVTIDGIDVRELDKDSIRGNITIISQNPYIFNMSFKDNLRLVKNDVTDKEIKEACKLACLDDFIESLPDKYDTIVGEGGVTLSGGQRQRLAIARALVQKTEIILFDEATSALDNETQDDIQEAINNMKKNYTILIIAHRLSTVIHSDRILFLNDGKIEAEGSHKYLLKHCPEYKKLYESELQK